MAYIVAGLTKGAHQARGLIRALADAGVAFEADPHCIAQLGDKDLWLAICRDPDGNLVGLMSEKEAAR